jgi:hypothetical protein
MRLRLWLPALLLAALFLLMLVACGKGGGGY